MPGLKPLVAFKNVTLLPAGPFLNWEIGHAEHWLICGGSESVKKELFEVLSGKKRVTSGTVYHSLTDTKTDYFLALSKHSYSVNFLHPSTLLPEAFYQQRYHASESETGPSLREFIISQLKSFETTEQYYALLLLFELNERLDEPIIHLSTGEFRKLAIVLGLVKKPRLLLLNEPYAGLDNESIEMLDSILLKLSKNGLNIFLSSSIDHIPAFITHFLKLNHSEYSVESGLLNTISQLDPIIPDNDLSFELAFNLKNLTIHDGNKKLLDSVNWTVRKGEKWALLGRNGAGKSMLLSVIFGDHPQAYANRIVLFDRPRGSGESIWEIREQIGFFSSELFLYSDKSKTCRELAYSHFRSNPYKFNSITKEEKAYFVSLMDYFSLSQYNDSPLQFLPTNIQRLVFLIAVFLKNAPLLILDEPFHGFEISLVEKLKCFLDRYCRYRTFIFVSHRKSEIPSVVSKLLYVQKGKAEIRAFS